MTEPPPGHKCQGYEQRPLKGTSSRIHPASFLVALDLILMPGRGRRNDDKNNKTTGGHSRNDGRPQETLPRPPFKSAVTDYSAAPVRGRRRKLCSTVVQSSVPAVRIVPL